MAPTIAWFRRDLRLHDLPMLQTAAGAGDALVPLVVLDERLLRLSPYRTAFWLRSVHALDAQLRARGSRLVVRRGRPEDVVPRLAEELGASAVCWTSDVAPVARRRDAAVRAALGDRARPHPGTYAVELRDVPEPFAVFSRFRKAHTALPRRPVLPAPDALPPLPDGLDPDDLPEPEGNAPEPVRQAGEPAARAALQRWLAGDGIDRYGERVNDMARVHVSQLSPYLRHGCLSARECEAAALARGSKGGDAWARQLAWRDFHAHHLLHDPHLVRREQQPRYRDGALRFDDRPDRLAAWQEGRTGFPLVDAGMRQLLATGWMHNRVRLVVGSFLTKTLHLDWRAGVAHFDRLLLDGEPAQNVGNWQWIASTGTDPQPAYRRLYNPVLHAQRLDPDGAYVRRYVPELRDVPTARIFEPWEGTLLDPPPAGYPERIVDLKAEREVALARYREASGAYPE